MITEEKLKSIYEEEFQTDPIYQLVIESKLEGYLYPSGLLNMDLNKTYSTVDVGKMIGRKDSTIRNYFSTDLVDYINPEKVGILYRLDYINIIKIHMISLLYEKGGKNRTQLQYALGLKSGVKIGKENPGLNFKKELDHLKQHMVSESLKSQYLSLKLNIQEQINEKNLKQMEYNQFLQRKNQLEKEIKQKDIETKYIHSMTDALQNVSEQEQQTRLLLNETRKKRGVFGWLRKERETDNKEQSQIVPEFDAIKKLMLENKEEKKQRAQELKDIENKLKYLEENIKTINAKIEDLNLSVQEKSAYIENLERNISIDQIYLKKDEL